MAATPIPPSPARLCWRRWIADPAARQLTQGVDPRRLALTLAVGSALSLFPLFGTTALLCGLAGLALGLNQPIIQAVNAGCNLIWVPFLVGFIRLGDHCTGVRSAGLDLPAMLALSRRDPAQFFRRCDVTVRHALLGWVIVIPFWIPVVYGAALPLLQAAARGALKRRARATGAA